MGRREKPLDPDAGPMERLAHDLRTLREKAGKPTYREMAKRAGYSASALSQAAAGEQLPSPELVRAYALALEADPEQWEERRREADRAIKEAAEQGGGTTPPYQGLGRYEPDDRERFFGRDRLVGELLDLVREHRFAAVCGPSGSGKSSLLRAGLIPALHDVSDTDRPAVIRVLTPGELPARSHARALVPKDGEQDTWVIVDQFEELFTLCHDREERTRFLHLLLAAQAPESRLRVVAAVRGDFYGHCSLDRRLAEAVSRATLLVGPMNRDELREVVTGPATAAGLTVERALTARIVDEVVDQPGALPMLSHALLETWRRRRGRMLTMAAYDEAGGVHGAIAATADEMYAELPPVRARAARRALLRLIAPGDGTADTRRPARRSELGDAARDVLERLARARLITLDGDTVELAHEALITGWPRLSGWIEEDRERLREERRLGEAARLWEELGRDPGALYRGTRLIRAEEMFLRPSDDDGDGLTPSERAFLTASLTVRDAEREAEARTARRSRRLTVALSVFLVVALAAGLLAWQRDRASQEEAAKAAARRLASVADSLRPTDPRTAELLSVAAWRLSPLTESRGALLRALAQPERDAFNDPQTGRDARRFLTDGGRTLVSVASSRVTTWRVTDHRRLGSYRLPDGMEVAAVSPDARTLGLVGPDGNQLWQPSTDRTVADLRDSPVITWFAGDGKSYLVTPLEGPGTAALHRIDDSERLFGAALPGPVSAASVGADGRLVAVCPANGSPHLWDASRNKRLSGAWDEAGKDTCGTGSGADSGANMVRLSADGTRLAVTSGTAFRVWDIPSGRLVADVASPGDSGFTLADLSRDGRFLAASDGQELAVWRLGGDPVQVFGRALSGTELHGLAWDPGKDGVLRSFDDGIVRTYDLTTVLSAGWRSTPSETAVLSPDGTTLATATRSGGGHRLELRSTRTGALVARAALGASTTDDATPLLTFSPDGRALAAADATDSAHLRLRVWDTAGGKVRTSLTLPRGVQQTVSGIALGPGGRTLLVPRGTGDADVVDVWDIGGGRAHRSGSIEGLTGAPMTVRGDGRLIASAADQVATLPGRVTGRVTGRALAAGENVTALAFSPDGTRLAVGDSSGRVTLWDGDVRRRMGVLPGTSRAGAAPEGVAALAFSPNGHTLAVGGTDGTLQLWDTASQQSLVGALPTPGDPLRSVAFSRDGGTLFAAGQYVPLQSYAVDPAKAITVICDRTGSGLTEAQWRTYVPDAPYRAICDR
ncbi:nSTAND1 domain-containing NTPase [Streptomyces sp. DSM 40750]|uniref:nSTAND1 domain-containing NTPase n=1 Tax=Streptomyces sp. DSM 40750 TaxID=2801030 RepID=UPI00214C1804|nr:hypothetical protein [Streptomyces sp. DSM 40750]UUU19470.1 hypothetical protein JIX55_03650 [Streptomyces sp. DSM 40750]UUU27186.1 hypothetical protein JIX55_47105 [Streptomyces sp. DSM 40750]